MTSAITPPQLWRRFLVEQRYKGKSAVIRSVSRLSEGKHPTMVRRHKLSFSDRRPRPLLRPLLRPQLYPAKRGGGIMDLY